TAGTLRLWAAAREVSLPRATAAARDPEAIRKRAAARRGRKASASTRAKQSAAATGRRHSAETRRKMSAAQRRRWRTRRAGPQGAADIRAKDWTDEELDRKSVIAKRAGIRPGDRWKDRRWTREQEALLGTDLDEVIAERIGRTTQAVRCRRTGRGIRTFRDR